MPKTRIMATPRARALRERAVPATPPTLPSKDLQVFANPQPKRDYVIHFDIPEFTCNCPLTGQPDFAHIEIDCIPDKLCVELKSLKLYMWSYRNEGAFHEKVTNSILDDLVKAIDPASCASPPGGTCAAASTRLSWPSIARRVGSLSR